MIYNSVHIGFNQGPSLYRELKSILIWPRPVSYVFSRLIDATHVLTIALTVKQFTTVVSHNFTWVHRTVYLAQTAFYLYRCSIPKWLLFWTVASVVSKYFENILKHNKLKLRWVTTKKQKWCHFLENLQKYSRKYMGFIHAKQMGDYHAWFWDIWVQFRHEMIRKSPIITH